MAEGDPVQHEPPAESHASSTPEPWRWLAERFSDRALTLDMSLEDDLAFDSMDWLHLALDLERREGVALSDGAIGRAKTVRDLMREVATSAAPRASFLADPEAHLGMDGQRWLEPLGPREAAVARVLHRLNRAAMRTFFRLRVVNSENVPGRQVIFAPTHGSYLDAFALAAALDYQLMARTFWAADTGLAFGRTLPRRASRLAQAFPFDAEGGFIAGMSRATAVLNRGYNLIWFPEGWLSRTGDLQEFMPGIGMLLRHHPVPVVPIAIGGAHEASPKGAKLGAKLSRFRPVTVAFGQALELATLERSADGGGTNEERIANALRAHTADLHERTRRAALERG